MAPARRRVSRFASVARSAGMICALAVVARNTSDATVGKDSSDQNRRKLSSPPSPNLKGGEQLRQSGVGVSPKTMHPGCTGRKVID